MNGTELAKSLINGTSVTPPLKILFLLTFLSLLPAIVLTMTSFVRTVVVLSFLRQGMSTQGTPPTQVIVGLSLFLTAFTMAPVARQMQAKAIDPYTQGTIDESQALDFAQMPVKAFMLRQTRQTDLELFYGVTQAAL